MKAYLQKKLHKSLYNKAYSRAYYTLIGVFFQEIKCSFTQFYTLKYPIRSGINLLGVLSSSILRLFLGRSLKYSFAFTGEDRIIESILKPRIYTPGFYVEVGCNHPKFLSNTYSLYKKGWKGICIDANQTLINKYRLHRPNDIAISAVVSNEIKNVDFYEIENDVLSTLHSDNLEEAIKLDLSYKTFSCQTTTLTSILQHQSAPTNFDILSIDAEEHDYEVLSSLDFSIYSPKLIIVEDESFNFNNYTNNRFVTFLTTKDYILTGYVLKNAYFIKNSKQPI